MIVENRTFYHIHRNNWRHSDEWTVGSNIHTEKHEFSFYFYGLLEEPRRRSFYRQNELHLVNQIKQMVPDADEYHQNLSEYLSSEQVQNLRCFNMNIICSLDQCGEYLEQSLKVTRELIFEQVRQKHYSTYPSRLNCIWLCEKEELQGWWDEFSDKDDKYILEVSATGKIFKADGAFITHDIIRFLDFFDLAHSYWQGNKHHDCIKRQPETLFSGRLEVVKKYENLDHLTNSD